MDQFWVEKDKQKTPVSNLPDTPNRKQTCFRGSTYLVGGNDVGVAATAGAWDCCEPPGAAGLEGPVVEEDTGAPAFAEEATEGLEESEAPAGGSTETEALRLSW
jgi:hypothetical protein